VDKVEMEILRQVVAVVEQVVQDNQDRIQVEQDKGRLEFQLL
jgi:hypothetical protein